MVKDDKYDDGEGGTIFLVRKKAKLSPTAVLSVFEGQPSYMTTVPSVSREGVRRRRNALMVREEETLNDFLENDHIIDFSDFLEKYRSKIDYDKWNTYETPENVCFMRHENILGEAAPY